MQHVLPHEHLKVYEKALAFVRIMTPLNDMWPPYHSVRDQMDRACESLVVNLVKAAYHQRTSQGIYHLECSVGSVLECAACLDVVSIKGLLDNVERDKTKRALLEIARMEIGLRRSWCPTVHEEAEQYGEKTQHFPHESLQVYQRALQLCQLLVSEVLTPDILQSRQARKIDEAITSLLLNIAEGNGRFSQLDHRQFITIAEEAGVKLAAYLDLVSLSNSDSVKSAKAILHEEMAMLVALKGYLVGREVYES